jgi:hypothetical protein
MFAYSMNFQAGIKALRYKLCSALCTEFSQCRHSTASEKIHSDCKSNISIPQTPWGLQTICNSSDTVRHHYMLKPWYFSVVISKTKYVQRNKIDAFEKVSNRFHFLDMNLKNLTSLFYHILNAYHDNNVSPSIKSSCYCAFAILFWSWKQMMTMMNLDQLPLAIPWPQLSQ